MRFEPLKVGELAGRTGVTVRTLHHYDEIGLVVPSHRTEAGHRYYAAGDVARLQQVISLKHLGFSLDEVRGCLHRQGFAPLDVVRRHRARLKEQIDLQKQLCDRLDALAGLLASAEEVSADEFLKTIEVMTVIETLYTPDEMKQFEEAGKAVGQDEITAVQDAWGKLLPEIRANLHLDPAGEKAQELGRKWEELTARTMAGFKPFPGLAQKIEGNYKAGKFEGFPGAPQAAEFEFMAKVKAARK
jgi:DNA-binding transcriptional MerR regulator